MTHKTWRTKGSNCQVVEIGWYVKVNKERWAHKGLKTFWCVHMWRLNDWKWQVRYVPMMMTNAAHTKYENVHRHIPVIAM